MRPIENNASAQPLRSELNARFHGPLIVGASPAVGRSIRSTACRGQGGALHPMATRAQNRRDLSDLRGNQREPLFRQPKNIHLNVEQIVRAELGDDSPRQEIEILEALEDTSEGAGISVRSNPKPK
jgi:hypothetical protein